MGKSQEGNSLEHSYTSMCNCSVDIRMLCCFMLRVYIHIPLCPMIYFRVTSQAHLEVLQTLLRYRMSPPSRTVAGA